MKTNCWLVLGMMMATSAVAQVSTNALPEIPAPATVVPAAPAVVKTNTIAPAPKKKVPITHKKKAAAKKISEPASALVAGSATVISPNLNMRGQAGMKGEVVGHLKSGDAVNVISQINLDKHAADEPAQWAKISLPTGTKVWVDSKFVDATNKVVSAKKLNLRAGPGENYSVLGVLQKGASVSEIATKGDWAQIETPANAFAFVAAMYLKQAVAPAVEPATAAPVVAETPVVVPPPTASTVAEATPVVAQSPTAVDAAVATNVPAVVDTNAAALVVDTNPPPPRVVSHEGYVRSSSSLVAPTAYELFDLDSGNAINYLYSTSTNLDISRYYGFQVIVTGEEGISARWADTPVLTLQKIYVLSTNSLPIKRVSSPRATTQQHQRR